MDKIKLIISLIILCSLSISMLFIIPVSAYTDEKIVEQTNDNTTFGDTKQYLFQTFQLTETKYVSRIHVWLYTTGGSYVFSVSIRTTNNTGHATEYHPTNIILASNTSSYDNGNNYALNEFSFYGNEPLLNASTKYCFVVIQSPASYLRYVNVDSYANGQCGYSTDGVNWSFITWSAQYSDMRFDVYGVDSVEEGGSPEGDSTGSYNWIKNPSFEQTDEYAQDSYGQSTYPWFLPYGGTGYVEENTTYYKYGVRSLHTGLNPTPMTFWNLQYSYPIVAQSVTGVLSSSVENFTLWAMQTENYTSGIRVFVWFIDGTYDTMYSAFDNSVLNDWEFMNYTTIFNNYQGSNAKYLASVAFVQDGRGYTFIDAVNMWASVENPSYGTTFSFTLTPPPINYMNTVSGYGFNAYAGIQYTFKGFINNNTINGIFNVTALSIYQTVSTSGTVTNGQFSFIISPRSIAYASYENFDETFWIVISGSDLNTTYSVDGHWTAPSATPPTNTDDITQNNMNFLITILPYLIIYGLCIGGGAYYLKFVGVLLGLNVAMIIVLLTGVILNNISIIWVMPITILTDIVLVVFRPKEQSTPQMG